MNTAAKTVVLLSGMLFISACGGGGSGGGSSASATPDNPTPASYGLLKPVESTSELADSLRTGLLRSIYAGSPTAIIFEPTPALGEISDAPDAGDPGGFSGTNLQEVGVDEADIVKYDGEILYVLDSGQGGEIGFDEELSEPSAVSSRVNQKHIRLLRTDTRIPSAEQVAEIPLPQDDFSVEGFYLSQGDQHKHLVSVGHTESFFYWELFASDYYWRNTRTRVQAWDVSDAQNPSSAWSLHIDGSLLATRRIDNSLYLVTRFSPEIKGLIPYPQTEEQTAANQTLIEETPLADLLPKASFNEGPAQDLLTATDCYVPNPSFDDGAVLPAGGSLITVTVVNLNAPDQIQSICLNAWSSGFYASSEAIYVTANSADGATVIHKIALADSGPQYRGSGKVPGYIGSGNPAFLMSEANGDLRVISSTWDTQGFPLPVVELDDDSATQGSTEVEDDGFGPHRLTILRESADGTQLEKISQLPNASRPALIGKPGENVYAARFLGDRAYIVTFKVIDPLYVLDLSTPEDPLIAGELEIPGFSTLLQPVGENLLLGVGNHVPVAEQALIQGIKVALFDVANLEAPISLGEVIIGKRGSYSPALDNHHSLTLLNINGVYRAAIPIQRHEDTYGRDDDALDPWFWYGWTDSGLYMFDIDPGANSLSRSGTLIIDQSSEQQPYYTGSLFNARSVIHDAAVFFIHNGEVSAQFWGD